MYNNTRLIMLEGIPGSGKTTLAQRLHEYLNNHSIKSSLFIEGCKNHPINLAWYAYLSIKEYTKLLIDYSNHSEEIKKHSIIEENYILVQYKINNHAVYTKKLTEYLSTFEVCYSNKPIVSIQSFTEVFKKRFERFAENYIKKNEKIIFDGTFTIKTKISFR